MCVFDASILPLVTRGISRLAPMAPSREGLSTVTVSVVYVRTRMDTVGRVHWVLVKRNDDFLWEHRAVLADSWSIARVLRRPVGGTTVSRAPERGLRGTHPPSRPMESVLSVLSTS